MIFLLPFLGFLIPIAIKNNNVVARRFSLFIIAMWTFIFFISLQNPYGLLPVSAKTYTLLLIYVCSLVIGLSVSNKRNVNSSKYIKFDNVIQKQLDYLLDNKYVLIIVSICILFLLYIFSKQQAILLQISAMQLRNEGVQDLLFEGNSLLGLFNNFVVKPFTFIIEILVAYVLLYRRTKVLPLFLFTTEVLLSALIGGSRGVFLKILVYIIFIYFCCPFLQNKSSRKANLKLLLSVLVFAIIIFTTVSYLTAQRLYNIKEFSIDAVLLGFDSMLIHIETYLVGPFRALDYAFENDYFNKLGGPTLGRSTLGFIEGFFEIFFGKLGIDYTPANNIIYKTLQNNWIWIGRDFNFAYTPLLNYYMDFGLLGILIIPFVFGMIIKKYCLKLYRSKNLAILFLLAFFFNVIFESHFGWVLYHWNCFLILIYIYIIYKYFNKRINDFYN